MKQLCEQLKDCEDQKQSLSILLAKTEKCVLCETYKTEIITLRKHLAESQNALQINNKSSSLVTLLN
jgi:hypothetical protein